MLISYLDTISHVVSTHVIYTWWAFYIAYLASILKEWTSHQHKALMYTVVLRLMLDISSIVLKSTLINAMHRSTRCFYEKVFWKRHWRCKKKTLFDLSMSVTHYALCHGLRGNQINLFLWHVFNWFAVYFISVKIFALSR